MSKFSTGCTVGILLSVCYISISTELAAQSERLQFLCGHRQNFGNFSKINFWFILLLVWILGIISVAVFGIVIRLIVLIPSSCCSSPSSGTASSSVASVAKACRGLNFPLPLPLSERYVEAVEVVANDEDELDDENDEGLLVKLLIGVPSLPNKGGACLCSGKDMQRDSRMASKFRL